MPASPYSYLPNAPPSVSARPAWDLRHTANLTSPPVADADAFDRRIGSQLPWNQPDFTGSPTETALPSSRPFAPTPKPKISLPLGFSGSQRSSWAVDSSNAGIHAPNPLAHSHLRIEGDPFNEMPAPSMQTTGTNSLLPELTPISPASMATPVRGIPSGRSGLPPLSTHHSLSMPKKLPAISMPESLSPAVQLTVTQEVLQHDFKRHVLVTGASLSHSSSMPYHDWKENLLTDSQHELLQRVLETMRITVREQEEMVAKFHTVLHQVRSNPMHQLRLCHANEFDGYSVDGAPSKDAASWVRQIFSSEDHPRSSLHASCLMQTQLAWCSAERKQEIINAVRMYIIPLSEHQHGNWLVQKAIKSDSSLVTSLLGHCQSLAVSDFGYHVLVYAIKAARESCARSVVDELLSQNIYQTFRTKSAIHVWQQALEVNWVEQPSYRQQMIDQINTALRGRWADIARSEWGSILLQSWFESANEEEKEEAISELLTATPALLIHPRAVWVMEHLLKLGCDTVKGKVLDSIVQHAALITQSQYGHKVIAEALHKGDSNFFSRYAAAICVPSPPASSAFASALGAPSGTLSPAAQMELNLVRGNSSGRRPALIDLALRDPGGNMVMTLLSKSNVETRDLVLRTVARNSAFLKGDPNGSRVEKMCQRARTSNALTT